MNPMTISARFPLGLNQQMSMTDRPPLVQHRTSHFAQPHLGLKALHANKIKRRTTEDAGTRAAVSECWRSLPWDAVVVPNPFAFTIVEVTFEIEGHEHKRTFRVDVRQVGCRAKTMTIDPEGPDRDVMLRVKVKASWDHSSFLLSNFWINYHGLQAYQKDLAAWWVSGFWEEA